MKAYSQFTHSPVSSVTAVDALTRNFTKKIKTDSQIYREFELTKWRQMLRYIKDNSQFRLEDLVAFEFQSSNLIENQVISLNDSFYKLSLKEILALDLALFLDSSLWALEDAVAVYELGAGYGKRIFSLALELNFPSNLRNFGAGDLMLSAQKSMRELAKRWGLSVSVFSCDLNSHSIVRKKHIQSHSVMFTYCSLHYARKEPKVLAKSLAKLNCDRYLFFEPLFESYTSSPLDKVRIRYYLANGYYQPVLSVLEELARITGLKLEIHNHNLGINPCLPVFLVSLT